MNWKKQDFIALSLIPLQLLISWLFSMAEVPQIANAILAVAMISVAVFICIKIYGDVLKKDWENYRKKIGFKILFSILGAIGIVLILQAVRFILAPIMPDTSAVDESEAISNTLFVTLLISLIPLLNAFQEEVVFRHVIFYKFKDSKKYIAVFFFLLSAFLFGVVHLNNFNGNFIATIPYMVIGAFFNLIYLFTKNIWYAIGVHLVFNFAMGFLPLIFVYILQSFIG